MLVVVDFLFAGPERHRVQPSIKSTQKQIEEDTGKTT
jgi:hypothetical protein